jgi:hypothetical protein
MADLNIISVSTINARTVANNLLNTSANVITNTFGNSKTVKINNILMTNISGNTVTAYVDFVDYSNSNTSYPLFFNFDVPAKSTIEALAKPLYLEEGDKISAKVLGSAGGSVDSGNLVITLSYEELS